MRARQNPDLPALTEELFRAFFDNAPIGKSMTAPDGRLLRVNQAFGDMVGYTLDELHALCWQEITHPDDVEKTTHAVRDILAGERDVWATEKRYFAKDGHVVWTHITTRLQRDAAGTPLVFLTHIIDITKRKWTEAALVESARQLNEAQHLGRVGSWEYALDTQSLSWSDETFRLYERELALGPPSIDEEARYYEPEQAVVLRELARRAIEHGESAECDLEAVLPSGTRRSFAARLQPIKDPNGRVLKIFGTVHDITLRKQTEMALRQSEEKFAKAFQTAPYAIAITRPEDGKFIEANDAFSTISGFTREELLADSSLGLKLWVHEEDRRQVLAELRAGRAVVGREVMFCTKDGALITGLFSAQTIRLNEGLCILSSINDITPRKRAEEHIQRQLEELMRWQNVMLDREDRVQELKREINELYRRAGEAPRYPSQETTPADPKAAL